MPFDIAGFESRASLASISPSELSGRELERWDWD